MLAGVMVHMRRPHPTYAVAGAMDPIILEIVQHESERPGPPHQPPLLPKVEDAVLVCGQRGGDGETPQKRPSQRGPEPERKADKRVPGLVRAGRAPIRPNHLDHDRQHEEGNGVLGGGEVGHCDLCYSLLIASAQYGASLTDRRTGPNRVSPVSTTNASTSSKPRAAGVRTRPAYLLP